MLTPKAKKKMMYAVAIITVCILSVLWTKYKSIKVFDCNYKIEQRVIPGEPAIGVEEGTEEVKRCS